MTGTLRQSTVPCKSQQSGLGTLSHYLHSSTHCTVVTQGWREASGDHRSVQCTMGGDTRPGVQDDSIRSEFQWKLLKDELINWKVQIGWNQNNKWKQPKFLFHGEKTMIVYQLVLMTITWWSFIVIIISWLSRFVNTLIRVFSNYFIVRYNSYTGVHDGSKPILCSFVTDILYWQESWGNLKNVILHATRQWGTLEVPRVGRSNGQCSSRELTIIQYFTIHSDNGELLAAIHEG